MPLLENKIIAIENVWLSYTDKNILEDINLDIYQGDFLLITGPNGGKNVIAAYDSQITESD